MPNSTNRKLDFTQLIGAQFGDRGRGPWLFDCWGIVFAVRALAGKWTPDYDVSFTDQDGVARCVKNTKDQGIFMKVHGRPQALDIVEFKPIDRRLHFGVMINNSIFLDIRDDGAGVKPNRADNFWMKHLIAGFWRDR
jgi:hypothetical protein